MVTRGTSILMLVVIAAAILQAGDAWAPPSNPCPACEVKYRTPQMIDLEVLRMLLSI